MLDVEFAHCTDTGRVRQHNEDFLGHVSPATPAEMRSRGWLFALADGVGGQEAGEIASRTAVESVIEGFGKSLPAELLPALLRRLVQNANERVYSAGRNMSTTIVVCALRFDRAVVAHVGDSRCYLIRGGEAAPLTRDHTIVNEQIRLGVLSTGEAASAATRHMLSRSLGSDLFVNVDIGEHPVHPRDVLLLCSDGLHASVEPADMAAAVRDQANLEAAAQKLTSLANERDGRDNISVQLIRVRAIERMGMYRGRPYKLR